METFPRKPLFKPENIWLVISRIPLTKKKKKLALTQNFPRNHKNKINVIETYIFLEQPKGLVMTVLCKDLGGAYQRYTSSTDANILHSPLATVTTSLKPNPSLEHSQKSGPLRSKEKHHLPRIPILSTNSILLICQRSLGNLENKSHFCGPKQRKFHNIVKILG